MEFSFTINEKPTNDSTVKTSKIAKKVKRKPKPRYRLLKDGTMKRIDSDTETCSQSTLTQIACKKPSKASKPTKGIFCVLGNSNTVPTVLVVKNYGKNMNRFIKRYGFSVLGNDQKKIKTTKKQVLRLLSY